MPTLILLDSSLSMQCEASTSGQNDEDSMRISVGDSSPRSLQLATAGITHFLQLLRDTNKLEFVGFASFSHEIHTRVDFTRDHQALITAVSAVGIGTKAILEPALEYALEASRKWIHGTVFQLIIVTDGRHIDMEHTKLEHLLPFGAPSHISIVSVRPRSEIAASTLAGYRKILQANEQDDSSILCLEKLDKECCGELFGSLVVKHYEPFYGLLTCGHFSSAIQLFPPSIPLSLPSSHLEPELPRKWKIGKRIQIVGFLKVSEIGNPPVVTRHLVMPLPGKESKEGKPEETANFCVLLHGSLKIEGMAAICLLRPGWYGALFYLAESKKSSLTLNCFEPGWNSIPWLGRLSNLTTAAYKGDTGGEKTKSVFTGPLRPKPSYSHTLVSWQDPQNFQNDIQKLMRYAKRISEKQSQFYQELNRVVRHSMTTGFALVLEKLCLLLERELQSQPAPEVQKQLKHVCKALRNPSGLKFDTMIKPVK